MSFRNTVTSLKWNEEQDRLKKEGLSNKEIKNSAADARKLEDLKTIKKFGDGPFTSPDEVVTFFESDVVDKMKEERLYAEVRYARDTSLSLPKTSSIFRLKQNYKNLLMDTYVQNLKTYLSCTVNCTWADFDDALNNL